MRASGAAGGGNEGRASHAGGDDSGEGEGEGAGVGGGEAIVEGEGGRGRGSGNGHSDGRRAWASDLRTCTQVKNTEPLRGGICVCVSLLAPPLPVASCLGTVTCFKGEPPEVFFYSVLEYLEKQADAPLRGMRLFFRDAERTRMYTLQFRPQPQPQSQPQPRPQHKRLRAEPLAGILHIPYGASSRSSAMVTKSTRSRAAWSCICPSDAPRWATTPMVVVFTIRRTTSL